MSEKVNANAWYDLALVYFCGRGVQKDFDKAGQLLKIAADAGCAAAQHLMASIDSVSDDGIAVEIVKLAGCDPEGGIVLPDSDADDVTSYKGTLLSAVEGNIDSVIKLASIYRDGRKPVAKSALVAQNWLRRACKSWDDERTLSLGVSLYESGSEEAAPLLRKLIDAGVSDAKYYLGECYCRGLGVARNAESAVELLREAADHGDAEAQCTLGGCYLRGEGVGKDVNKAFSLLRTAENAGCARAKIELASISDQLKEVQRGLLDATVKEADEGDAESQLELAEKYANGDDVDEDMAKAVEWYRKAFENESAPAEVKGKAGLELAMAYLEGKGVEKEGREAVKILIAAEEATADASVQSALGGLYLNLSGDSIIEPDFERGFVYLKKAAEQGDAAAEFGLGACYVQGWGAEKDADAARRWLARAATHGLKDAIDAYKEQVAAEIPDEFRDDDASSEDLVKYNELKEKALAGDSDAQYDLAEAYYYGQDGANENETEAVRWYRMSAAQDKPEAIYSLGICYYKGQGVDEDNDRALYWFQKGALLENADAEYMTGLCNLKGYGTNANENVANFWFERAAKKGHVKAMCQMGDGYRSGRGVLKKDDSKALEWYKRAAVSDDEVAQYWLARFYEEGRGGLRVDFAKAKEYYGKAAESGDDDAKAALERLG